MLTTQPEYAGKLRVYLNNLQQAGGEDVAVRNAYDTTPAKLEERVDAYAKAGKFEAAPVTGRAINPNRDSLRSSSFMPASSSNLSTGGNARVPSLAVRPKKVYMLHNHN